jgi:hypothetical protein
MEWTAVISILVPLVAFFGFLYKELKEWRKETREETQSIRAEIAEMRKGFQDDLRLQTERSDKLYQMFIDLLKSQNPKSNP